MHMSLLPEDTRLHVRQVILFRLLPFGVVALQLELLRLQVVARIILIADGKGHDVQRLEACDGRGGVIGIDGQHLQQRSLRLVARVLGTSLALGDPDILVLLVDGIMHVAAHGLRGLQHLTHRQRALHDECLVQAHQRANPGVDEQVVTDGYLTGRREAVVVEHHVQDGAVEHDVTVVTDEGVTLRPWGDAVMCKGIARGATAQDMLHDGFHEAQLEAQCGVYAHGSQTQDAPTHSQRQKGHHPFQDMRELPVVEQAVDGSPYLVVVVRANSVKRLTP